MNKENIKTTMNCQLLVGSRGPIRFYLDGFNPLEFIRLAELIKSHGGIITRPDFDTVTLSKPDHVAGTNHMRFHVDWLYNSIRLNKRQDINRYVLPEPVEKEIFYVARIITGGRVSFGNTIERIAKLQRQIEGNGNGTTRTTINGQLGSTASQKRKELTGNKKTTERTSVAADRSPVRVSNYQEEEEEEEEEEQPPQLSPQRLPSRNNTANPPVFPRDISTHSRNLFIDDDHESGGNQSTHQNQNEDGNKGHHQELVSNRHKKRRLTKSTSSLVHNNSKITPLNGCWRYSVACGGNDEMPVPILTQNDLEQFAAAIELNDHPEPNDPNYHKDTAFVLTPPADNHSSGEVLSKNTTLETLE